VRTLALILCCLFGAVLSGLILWRVLPGPETELVSSGETRSSAPPPEPLVVGRRSLFPEPRAASVEVPSAGARPPSPWVELNNEATSTLAEGELARAVEMFERCLAAEPEHEVFRSNLAEALVRLSKLEYEARELGQASAHLERALELGPRREDADVLAAILERWRQEAELAQDDWTEGSERFELSFDTRRDDILHRSHEVLEHLERAHGDLCAWFGQDPFRDGPPIRVVLYDRQDFGTLTGLDEWVGGVYDGVVRVSVEDLVPEKRWRGVLVHELVHVFVQALGGSSVPGWLNEGLAQLFEAREGALQDALERLRGAELYPLASLGGSLIAWQEEDAIARAYAQSLGFVVFLRTNHGDEALRRMVRACGTGGDAARGFQEWSQVPLETVFSDWAASLPP
jgi:tetratricopeptide (TPR) repeat protein